MEQIRLGKFSEKRLDLLLQEAPDLSDVSARIDFLSKQFLEVPYQESTLIGAESTDEMLVINLAGLDCFTFLDSIEALRASRSFAEFKNHLVNIRYQQGDIAYKKRNHFFTDWKEFNSEHIDDITEKIAGGNNIRAVKNLNEKDDLSFFLPGAPCRRREIVYIPSNSIDTFVLSRLRTGDYIGIYADQNGLDVSHVGIFLRSKGSVFLRHASRVHGKVVDEEFTEYINDKPGIIVLRPTLPQGDQE